MVNGTNASAPYYSYEYYLDYLDLIPVDEKKLQAHKYKPHLESLHHQL
uniref:Melanocortin 2 receptor accessory protein isoform alpha (Predicted) n=1 Tax=Callithrix jacchus TaxID=9483 RepID=B0VXF7_CALJA|nr:melanocortin 2 receptor accessory protein isoform alpha (predicted) [Callithrix jacchus]